MSNDHTHAAKILYIAVAQAEEGGSEHPGTDVDIITLTVTNTSDRTVKNSIYYYDPADENIKVGYTSDSSTIPTTTGVSIEKGKSLTYKIGK